tara:strand:+ start:403 stop:633 length:231 start_codon:yes stop_codon:yes gene_type:complete
MSLYSKVQDSLVRDYEVVRLLTDDTLDEITKLTIEELKGYEGEESSDQFIHQVIGEIIRKLIAKGVEHERNINKSV